LDILFTTLFEGLSSGALALAALAFLIGIAIGAGVMWLRH
jgi:hypothetical protein